MTDDISDIRHLYNSDPGKEDDRLERHQLEHDITWRYLEKFLPSGASILEIGAASGRYTHELAKRGFTITAVDLSDVLIEMCRKRISDAGLERNVRFLVVDARDLSELKELTFDAALLMGPLYHLVFEEDRKLALKETFRTLRHGGIIFSALISRFGILGDLMRNIPDWIEKQAEVRSIIKDGRDPDHWPKGGFRGYFSRSSEIVPLHEDVGFETMLLAGVEPAIAADDESYNKLQGARRQAWLDLLFEVSTEETIIGASRHLLYIGKKPEEK
jgi:SAM-dependent methyltransferase